MKNYLFIFSILLLSFSTSCKKNSIGCKRHAFLTFERSEYSINFHTALLYIKEKRLILVGYTSQSEDLTINFDFENKDLYNKEDMEDIYNKSNGANSASYSGLIDNVYSYGGLNSYKFEINKFNLKQKKFSGSYEIIIQVEAANTDHYKSKSLDGTFENICFQIIE